MQLEKAGEDDRFAHGIYFIPLAPLNTIEHIVPTIAEALQFSFYESSSPKKQLLDYVRHKKMLLLVDNFEHLIEGAELFSEMLAGAPELTLLVTSRERLNLQSEWIFTVNGMRYPLNEAAVTLEEIESYTAVQLFLNGTRKFNPGYTLTLEDKGAIVQICQMLGGLPLGVELASTWTRVLSCPEIAQEIGNSLDFLSSTLRDTPQRHHSLNAVFEHSWRLLSPQEQDILKKLSVFCGGFHQNAAQQVAGAGLPQLISLMDKSMLRRHSSGRYELHETIRQYVSQKLAENSEEERLVAIGHSDFYAEFVTHQRNRLRGPAQKQALAEMSGEIENIRMGWQRALTNRLETAIENYMIGLYHFYWIQGWTQEGADTFRAAVSALTDPIGMAGQAGKETEILLGRIMARQGAFNYRLGLHVQANRLLQESLNIFQHFNVVSELAYVYTYLGAAAYLQADYDAAEHLLQQSLQYAQTTRNQLGTTIAYHHLGLIAHTRKDYDAAQKYHQNSLALAQTLGEPFGIAVALNNLGMVAHAQGNYDEARELHRRSLALRREINDQWGIATTLNSLALIAYAQEKYEQARQLLLESLNIYREIGDRKRTAVTLKDLSYVAQAQDQPEEAERLRNESLETFPNSGRQAGVATISTTLEAA
jgi:predicted ATPase